MARPILSVILSAKNGAQHLEPCLASLSAQKPRLAFEIHLVVSAGSQDGTYRKALGLQKKYKNLFIWKCAKPGMAAAFNFGAKKARGKILVFSCLDARYSKNWLKALTTPLLKDHGFPLVAMSGKTKSYFTKEKPNLWERYLDQLHEYWEQDRISAHPDFLPWAGAGNFAVKKDFFVKLGGFDEKWQNAAFDVDFSWRLALCGFMLGHSPQAEVMRERKCTLRSLMREIEGFAFYHQSILRTYDKLWGFSQIATKKKQIVNKAQRALFLMKETKNLRHASLRGVDLMMQISAMKGSLEAQFLRARPSQKLHPTRQGITPLELRSQLTRGYSHLHKQGWVYWKFPQDISVEGDLMLMKPKRKRNRHRLPSYAWKIWEVKSEGGQSEDAAIALGENENDPTTLRKIDETTLDIHSLRLLP